jgi:cellulose synthase/poly-beta-1,6-N-acetylglucosamine synthase-like glycosyltransferase
LPAELSFLLRYGVSLAVLRRAASEASRQAIPPECQLFAAGFSERFYYRCLAHWLGADFVEGGVKLGACLRYPHAVLAGLAPIEPASGRRWLAAPRGKFLAMLLTHPGSRRLTAGLSITTPSHLSRLARAAAAQSIRQDSALGLLRLDPDLSAAMPPNAMQHACAVAATGSGAFWLSISPKAMLLFVSLAMTCLFLASIWLRLFAGAASAGCRHPPNRARLEDRWLPVYSVVIALYREARVVPQLIAALGALDYPKGKLDIKFVIEHDDLATKKAIEARNLPANYELIVAPPGHPRTKPRALNVALPLARGEFLTVFDAEDRPAPSQLREAAERFLRSPPKLACLQARLAIDNVEDSWLTRLFAIEYAVLFDVLNPGYAALGLPVPLGGTSNHFRTHMLRELCGWDAWNVTEDADLGFRLARAGYAIGVLSASTQEEAPARLGAWLKQRRRWSKGWMQTLITLTRTPRRLAGELGSAGAVAAGLMLTSLVAAPLLWPFFTALLVYDLRCGLPAPGSWLSRIIAVLWLSTLLFGAASIAWLALLGMQRRKLTSLWPWLPLLPLYYLMTSAASWLALYDLNVRPFHWHKTEHGLARTSRQEALAALAREELAGGRPGKPACWCWLATGAARAARLGRRARRHLLLVLMIARRRHLKAAVQRRKSRRSP